MRRDFGHVNFDNSHMGGHRNFGANGQYQYYSEQGNQPIPPHHAARPVGRAVLDDPEIAEFEAEFPVLGNPELPVYGYRTEIREAVRDNPVTILVGETGSGKSTQIPQILLETGRDVVLSQPRRPAARNVAERIQDELTSVLGSERAAGLVGHKTAEQSTVIEGTTRISVITDGIVALQQLHEKPADGNTKVYMIDEVHEWNVNIELTVALIKRHIANDPSARFILTSATMDAYKLAAYFAEVTDKAPPVIEVPGRVHDIVRHEMPNSTVLRETLKSIENDPDTSILDFLPGKREISDTLDAVGAQLPAGQRATLLPLHAKLRPEEQDRVSRPTPSIKVIAATNVAQTSLTIPEVDLVIDSGLERRMEIDEEGVGGLRVPPVSQADLDQRAGRTGRVRPGVYVLTKYDDNTPFVPYMDRPKYPVPEILRTPVDRTMLIAAAANIDLAETDLFHKVTPAAIERARSALYNIGALDEQGVITSMGRRMAEFPVRPTSARMLMEALPFSTQVRGQLAAIVAAVEAGGLPYFAHDVGKAWKQLTEEKSSDLLMQLDLFIATQDMTDTELTEYDLDVRAVRQAQELYATIVHRGHVGEVNLAAPTDDERACIEQAICAGLIDWVYQYAGDGEYERMSGGADSTLREFSGRSIVDGRPKLAVGSPYRVEFMRGGEPHVKHILEGVTAISSPELLGKVAAAHLLSEEVESHVWRDGRLKQVVRQVFNHTVKLSDTRELDALNTKENKAYVLDSLLEGPGSAQRQLRDIKKELERLQHRTKEHVPQLTQDMLLGWLDEAMAAAEGDLDQRRIDSALRDVMVERGIGLDMFMPAEDRSLIRTNAPAEIAVGGGLGLQLSYRHGTPVVTSFSWKAIEDCPERLCLPDGREVMFRHGRQLMTLAEVRADYALLSYQ